MAINLHISNTNDMRITHESGLYKYVFYSIQKN